MFIVNSYFRRRGRVGGSRLWKLAAGERGVTLNTASNPGTDVPKTHIVEASAGGSFFMY